jgi:hypothetical protein
LIDYEPAERSGPGSPASKAISNYEEFSKRQLPQLVRRRLEAAAENEAQPIEEKLKTLLVEIVKDCQVSVFSLYQEQRRIVATGNVETTNADPAPSSSASQANTVIHAGETSNDIMNDMLIPLYQQNTLQDMSASCPELQNTPKPPQDPGKTGSSESGYGSLQSACKCFSTCHCGTALTGEIQEESNPGNINVPHTGELSALEHDDIAILFSDLVDHLC